MLLAGSAFSGGQAPPNGLGQVTHSATLTFFLRDGSCVFGTIAKADAKILTVNPASGKPVSIKRDDLLQVSQGGALLFSARSSWSDVASSPVNSQEAFLIRLKNGRKIIGKPIKVTPDTIDLEHGFAKTVYPKPNIATVTYLRVKPETDNLDYLSQEAPFLLFFDPEFYSRTMRLEGRIPVLLYDSSLPENDTALQCPRR